MTVWLRTGAVAALLVLTTAGASRAQDPDPAFRADVEKLLEVTGARALGAQMANMSTTAMLDRMRKTRPDISERFVTVVKEVLSAEFAQAFDSPGGLHDQIVGVYAKHFTHDEVKGLIAFYTSTLGRKAVAELPLLAQESAALGQQWATTNTPRIVGALEKRLRDEKLIP
jgi:hypothetical protein